MEVHFDNLNKGDTDAEQALRQLRAEGKQITCLILKGNSLTEAFCDVLAEFISHNYQLKELSLEFNHTGLSHSLAEAIGGHRALAVLDLRSNRLVNKDAKYVAYILRHNSSLECMDLRWNDLGWEAGDLIEEALQRNSKSHLLQLLLDGNMIDRREHIEALMREKRRVANDAPTDLYKITLPGNYYKHKHTHDQAREKAQEQAQEQVHAEERHRTPPREGRARHRDHDDPDSWYRNDDDDDDDDVNGRVGTEGGGRREAASRRQQSRGDDRNDDVHTNNSNSVNNNNQAAPNQGSSPPPPTPTLTPTPTRTRTRTHTHTHPPTHPRARSPVSGLDPPSLPSLPSLPSSEVDEVGDIDSLPIHGLRQRFRVLLCKHMALHEARSEDNAHSHTLLQRERRARAEKELLVANLLKEVGKAGQVVGVLEAEHAFEISKLKLDAGHREKEGQRLQLANQELVLMMKQQKQQLQQQIDELNAAVQEEQELWRAGRAAMGEQKQNQDFIRQAQAQQHAAQLKLAREETTKVRAENARVRLENGALRQELAAARQDQKKLRSELLRKREGEKEAALVDLERRLLELKVHRHSAESQKRSKVSILESKCQHLSKQLKMYQAPQ